MTICRYENVRMHDIRKMDELKVSRDDNTCKPFCQSCQYKRYHGDMKYHMTLNTISSVVMGL